MRKLNILPLEIFNGDENNYYNEKHLLKINDRVIFLIQNEDYYFNHLENPSNEDSEIIKDWAKNTAIQSSKEFIRTYKGSFNVPLKYCIKYYC